MRASRSVLVLVAALSSAAPHALAAPASREAADVMLDEGFPPITDAQKAMQRVEYFPGAKAVVLLAAEQHEVLVRGDLLQARNERQIGPDVIRGESSDSLYQVREDMRESKKGDVRDTDAVKQRIDLYRRVKILDSGAPAEASTWSQTFVGRWRLQKIEARTVLPDGRILDAASGVHRVQEKGASHDDEVNRLEIEWPDAAPGAILDLYMSAVVDELPATVWNVQERLPVADSRLILEGPRGLVFSTVGIRMAKEETSPTSFKFARGQAHVWRWNNVPPAGVDPHAPPADRAGKSLIVFPQALREGSFKYEWAADWASWNKDEFLRVWQPWLLLRSQATTQLAKDAAAGVEGRPERIAAIRTALASKVTEIFHEYGKTSPSPDDVLQRGRGTVTEVAGVLAAMLRAVDIPADVMVYRRRGSGPAPDNVPLPVLYDGALVVVRGEGGRSYVDPVGSTPVGELPVEAHGVVAFTLDGVASAPEKLPDLTAKDNRVVRITRGTLSPEGDLEAETTFTWFGADAGIWRERLAGLDAAGRRRILAGELFHPQVPDASIRECEFQGLEGGRSVVAKIAWSAPGFARDLEGKRELPLVFFGGFSPADWTADARSDDLDFGLPRDATDVVSITLPAGSVVEPLPVPVDASAPPVGSYRASFQTGGSIVTLRRNLRMDMAQIPAAAYPSLKPWLRDVAKSDATTVRYATP